MDFVEIYAVGAVLPTNPGRGGAGMVFSAWRNGLRITKEYGFYLGEPLTNNAAEMRAAIKALDSLTRPCIVTLYSSSQYLIKTMTVGWQRGKNFELWAEIDRAAAPHTVTWQWLRGDGSDIFNASARSLAELAAQIREDVRDAS